MKYIIFTYEGTMLPVAHKLQEEGNQVLVGMIHDKADTLLPDEKLKPEEPDKKKKRLALYDGLLKKTPARTLIRAMARLKDKNQYIVLTDSNSCYKFTTAAEKLGFTGLIARLEDRTMEVDRNKAKEFVKANYPDLKVAKVSEFKTIKDGIQFLEESDRIWVLKSLGDEGATVVPQSDEPDNAKEELRMALEEDKKDYESNGFMFEEKITDPIELTPQVIFYDGKPVYFSLDIENKTMAAGNEGSQIGCAQNLIVATKEEDPINKAAFPPIVYEMAGKRKGMYIVDCGILIDKKGNKYFSEFCFQRFGWDAMPTEAMMSESTTSYFESIIAGKNPLKYKFGAEVRVLNMNNQGHQIEEEVIVKHPECVYLYRVYKNGDKMISSDIDLDFAAVTGSDDDLFKAVENCYEYEQGLIFEGKYKRPKFDFLSSDYPTSIINRYNKGIEMGLFEGEPVNNDVSLEEKVEQMRFEVDKDLNQKYNILLQQQLQEERDNHNRLIEKIKNKIKDYVGQEE